MKVVLLENILHKGQRYKAGASLELDAETAGKFEQAGIAIAETVPKPVEVVQKAVEISPKVAGSAPNLPSDERKVTQAGKKASASKKAARGQK